MVFSEPATPHISTVLALTQISSRLFLAETGKLACPTPTSSNVLSMPTSAITACNPCQYLHDSMLLIQFEGLLDSSLL